LALRQAQRLSQWLVQFPQQLQVQLRLVLVLAQAFQRRASCRLAP
jgi:hypothetical protein